jgi:hypothetical protein
MDWSVIEGKPKEVKVKGKIHAIFDDLNVASVSPLSDKYAVSLYPRKGKVYYLIFDRKEDLESQAFTVDEGTLRLVDGKQFIINMKRSSEEF